jgi:hypothetical protein
MWLAVQGVSSHVSASVVGREREVVVGVGELIVVRVYGVEVVVRAVVEASV